MISAIVFDFDGTLIDSTDSIWGEYQRVIGLMGLEPISFSEFTAQLGKPWDAALRSLWPGVDVLEFSRLYRGGSESLEPFVGVHSVLEELGKRYRLALLTSRGRTNLLKNLGAAKIDPRVFEVVFDRDGTDRHKPDPGVLLTVSERLGVGKDEVLYVGDSLVDAACARGAGIFFVGVLSGGTTRSVFEEAGVEHVIESVADLPNLIDKAFINQ